MPQDDPQPAPAQTSTFRLPTYRSSYMYRFHPYPCSKRTASRSEHHVDVMQAADLSAEGREVSARPGFTWPGASDEDEIPELSIRPLEKLAIVDVRTLELKAVGAALSLAFAEYCGPSFPPSKGA
ncbi:hypothetical protein EIP91_006159 [Steccherinum ochraceum]|uniref:Uncharacterized protein n=1 Tax=Steccherinum ochraceum TaxID=92696 RepID=A0A4V6N729_9APHY|nr:hypothetical protein EIP91_006159 [Steccherinum ochraceum]